MLNKRPPYGEDGAGRSHPAQQKGRSYVVTTTGQLRPGCCFHPEIGDQRFEIEDDEARAVVDSKPEKEGRRNIPAPRKRHIRVRRAKP